MDLSAFREEYLKDTLHRRDLADTPFEQFDRWFKQAMESGIVPVYLNPEAPEKSVLSKGIPPRNYILPSLFALIALTLICTGSYCLKRSH